MGGIAERLTVALADRYAIERELGQGGMATVYLAHDVRHNRKVALKVLRPELAAMIGAERFLKEIEVTAGLQHPHILPLHDSGEADSFLYYVMPYVEGETLRTRLDRQKQLGIEEAVELTRSVAAALDYAHRHGVIHRDIKPENVLVHDGQAMVADFGIALAVSQAGGHRLTETGLSLGTPHYMSPEQAMGDRELDARSDIYSLGAMLYEMLTGDPPHTGSTAQAIVAKVITEKAPLVTTIRDTVPVHVAAAVHKALAKLPADRFPTAHEFAEALVRPGTMTLPPDYSTFGSATSGARRSRVRLAALIGTPALVAGILLGWLARPRTPAPLARFNVGLNGLAPDCGMNLSPNGSMLAFGSLDSTGIAARLYLRRFDQLEPQLLASVRSGCVPTFSPDGRELAFIDPPSRIQRVSVLGSPPTTITDSAAVGGLAWGEDGWIYFSTLRGEVARVRPSGGPHEVLLPRDSSTPPTARVVSSVLPSGKAVLLTLFRPTGGTQAAALDLSTRRLTILTDGMRPVYAEPDRLLFASAAGQLAQAPFDPNLLALTGAAEPVGSNLFSPVFGWVDVALSRNGTLAYLTAPASQGSDVSFVVVDRAGKGRALPIPPGPYQSLGLSPDGRQVAAELIPRNQDGGTMVTFRFGDSVVTHLTFEGLNRYPAWTADGRRIAFSQLTGSDRDLVWKPSDGSGREEPLLERPGPQFEVEFSRDGRWMIYREGDANGANRNLGIRYRSLGPGGLDTVFVDTRSAEFTPTLSPDGQWLAYTSDASGTNQVYVRPFPPDGSGAVWQVSTQGGSEPVWARSGRELFYKESGTLMAAEVRATSGFTIAARRRLFALGSYVSNPYHARYTALPGDEHFLMTESLYTGAAVQTVVVLNWRGEGKK